MQGFITHVSNFNISTACTTALKKIPDTCRLAPSYPMIINDRIHFLLIFLTFPTTTSQSSSEDVRI